MRNPKMNFILISEVGTGLIKRQLEITDIKFRRIYEDNRSFPNGTDLKFKFKIFNMGVDFI